MNSNNLKPIIGLVLSFALSTTAHAALVSMDRNEPGDGQITLDTQTGLKWLDLSLSVPLAIDSSNQFTLEGWQVATLTQVQTLIQNEFGSSISNNNRISVDPGKAQSFVELFGATFGNQVSWGRFQGSQANMAGQAIVRYDDGLQSYLIGNNEFNASSPHSFSGVFYVQSVPLPASVWLFASALLGFAGVTGRGSKFGKDRNRNNFSI